MKSNSANSGINALCQLIETLRGKNGCPWDKKQTPRTLTVYLLEETYELVEAIEKGNPDSVCEELGDILFLILFIARMFQEKGHFDIRDVADVTLEKMIRRHPHVFGGDRIGSADEVKEMWHKIKKKEKNDVQNASILDSVPSRLPALMRAYRISERAAGSGFDWNDLTGVMQKVEEEWSELKAELDQAQGHPDRAALEFGDVLFTLVNVARFAHFHPEMALTGSIKKFEKRFKQMERVISDKGKELGSVSQNEKDRIWEDAKKED